MFPSQYYCKILILGAIFILRIGTRASAVLDGDTYTLHEATRMSWISVRHRSSDDETTRRALVNEDGAVVVLRGVNIGIEWWRNGKRYTLLYGGFSCFLLHILWVK